MNFETNVHMLAWYLNLCALSRFAMRLFLNFNNNYFLIFVVSNKKIEMKLTNYKQKPPWCIGGLETNRLCKKILTIMCFQ
jgi:hypothetical protein